MMILDQDVLSASGVVMAICSTLIVFLLLGMLTAGDDNHGAHSVREHLARLLLPRETQKKLDL